jgi:hypothetical protein
MCSAFTGKILEVISVIEEYHESSLDSFLPSSLKCLDSCLPSLLLNHPSDIMAVRFRALVEKTKITHTYWGLSLPLNYRPNFTLRARGHTLQLKCFNLYNILTILSRPRQLLKTLLASWAVCRWGLFWQNQGYSFINSNVHRDYLTIFFYMCLYIYWFKWL